MKKKSKKISQLEEESPKENQEMDKKYVEAQRKKKSKGKANSTYETGDDVEQQILDIRHGDKFVREHIRPSFLKRWDGESNTLELTEDQLENISPMLRIYWQHKSKNMNCIIFVQIGRVQFYAYEDDAIRLHEIFKKPLRKFSNFLMVNFWSKEIELAKMELFERRIPVLMLNEMEDEKYREEFGIIRREITQVITPSIYLSLEPSRFRERVLLAIYMEHTRCGVACVDVETNHFYLEQYQQDSHETVSLHQIRRIINKYRPAELLIQKNNGAIKKIAKQVCQPYIIETAPLPGPLLETIQRMKQVSKDEIFGRMLGLYNKENFTDQRHFSLYPTVKVLSLLLNYMQNLSLEAKIFGQGIFQICDVQSAKLKPMFDAQVYENLEVFSLKDEEDSFAKPGTLYHYLNHCLTNSGQKLLKKWIDEPLRTIAEISKRQIAIQNLLDNKGEILHLQKQLLGFEKLERKVGNIYHYALKPTQQGKNLLTKQMRFDKDYDQKKNPAVMRIKQIYDVLKVLREVQYYFTKLSKYNLESQLLRKTCKIIDAGNLYHAPNKKLQSQNGLPSIQRLVSKLLHYVYIDESTGHIEPRNGINQIFDRQKGSIAKIMDKFDKILDEWKKKLGVTKISYVSVRARNQIQVPLSEVKNKKFPELIFSSQTTKMIRYTTSATNELSQQLINHEQLLAKSYQPFASMMVKQFCSHKHVWDLYISSVAKIDVLMSLAKVCLTMVPRCMPNFQQDRLFIKNGHHIGLLQVKPNGSVIGNTLNLQNDQKVLLLTGPNMGGKSTLLRQTCLLAILAQVGCFVPCQKYQTIVFDQIFCRIGASDRIIEGKSTFYVQLQQTKRIIDQSTPKSLVIVDQLGRGTSTYDGMALATSVLKYIIKQIECYTLFSTHYFPMAQQFMRDGTVICGKIGYDFDKKKRQIKFNYQLQKGVAEKSFANQVARQVGVSQESLALAEQKARQIEVEHLGKISETINRRLNKIISFIK